MNKVIRFFLVLLTTINAILAASEMALAQEENMIANGGFDDDFAWTVYDMSGNATATAEFGVADTALAPQFGDGAFLELSGEATYSNILVWQDLSLVGGQTYEFSGAFRDLTDSSLANFWCEIYISPEAPVDGTDWKPPAGENTERIIGFNTWDGCGPGIDGTFQDDGCEPPATRYYTAPGNPGEPVVIYFGVKTGVWSDNADPLFFDVAVDELKLVMPGTRVERKQSAPATFAMLQNYPNPFNPSTTIQFSLPEAGLVDLSIYDMRGRKAATLLHQKLLSGKHQMEWDGTNGRGELSPSGLYFVEMRTASDHLVKKISLVR